MAADLVELLEAVAERIDFIAPGMAGWDDMTEGKICRKAAREIAELRQRERDLRELCEDRSLNENEYGVELNIVARFRAILDKAPLEQAAAHLTACAGLA